MAHGVRGFLGLPGVCAAADTRARAKSAIRGALASHIEALQHHWSIR